MHTPSLPNFGVVPCVDDKRELTQSCMIDSFPMSQDCQKTLHCDWVNIWVCSSGVSSSESNMRGQRGFFHHQCPPSQCHFDQEQHNLTLSVSLFVEQPFILQAWPCGPSVSVEDPTLRSQSLIAHHLKWCLCFYPVSIRGRYRKWFGSHSIRNGFELSARE